MAPHSSNDKPDPSNAGAERAGHFTNPRVADGINNPPESHFGSFLYLSAGLVAVVAVFIILVNIAAAVFAPYIPFRWERSVMPSSTFSLDGDSEAEDRQEILRTVAARVQAVMDLPDDMEIIVHYNSGAMVNAFATLGGNIVVFQGLLDLVESEDELATVLAHEMAHVKHRDTVKGVVRMFGLMALMAGLGQGKQVVEPLYRAGGSGYSRQQETAADLAAVEALGRLYGHSGGASKFFTHLAEKTSGGGARRPIPDFLASHPDTRRRVETVIQESQRLGLATDGDMTPLPEGLR